MPKSIKLQNKDDIKKKKEFRQWLDPYSTGKYKGYDIKIKHSECVCDVKDEMETISEIIKYIPKTIKYIKS